MSTLSTEIQQRVAQFIGSEHLLPAPELADASTVVYVGLSGGPDSVALLHILHQLGYRCEALHCNFHLRSEESDRDEHFCRQLCLLLGVPLQVQQFDTHQYMARHHLSLEMAAREQRYTWWQELVSERQNSKTTKQKQPLIALGHHLDDSIETLLMNLMRGTGIQGLTGIVSSNDQTHTIRPLLCLTRTEILRYLDDQQLSYVTDSSNLECDTLRNEIRLRLLPLMQQILPQARQGIVTTMQHLRGTEHFALEQLHRYDRLTKHYCAWGIEWSQVEMDKLESTFGNHLKDFIHYWQQNFYRNGHRVVRTRHWLYTEPIDTTIFDSQGPELTHQIDESRHSAGTEVFDADTVTLPITIRRVQQGDRIAPLGLDGHTKLISDLCTNAHYSPMQKSTTWVVADASGAIIWVIGLRISHLHRVTEDTQHFLHLTIHNS